MKEIEKMNTHFLYEATKAKTETHTNLILLNPSNMQSIITTIIITAITAVILSPIILIIWIGYQAIQTMESMQELHKAQIEQLKK